MKTKTKYNTFFYHNNNKKLKTFYNKNYVKNKKQRNLKTKKRTKTNVVGFLCLRTQKTTTKQKTKTKRKLTQTSKLKYSKRLLKINTHKTTNKKTF